MYAPANLVAGKWQKIGQIHATVQVTITYLNTIEHNVAKLYQV